MKKIILLTSLFLALSSSCQEQQEDPVTPIFNEIRQEIISANPESPEWDLETFLGSQKAAEFKQKIQPLSQTDKSRLMHDTNNISEKDDTWPLIRDFLALSIKAGGYINTRLRYAQTFLGESVMHSDRSAVEFALEHKADINLKSVYPCPLLYASDYYIAQLLVDEGALEPSKNDNDEQLRLLQRAVRYDRPYQLLELYAKGFKPETCGWIQLDAASYFVLLCTFNYPF